MLELSCYLITTLGLDPICCPLSEVVSRSLVRIGLVNSQLNRADKVWQRCVGPLMLIEVDFKTVCEGFPTNQEDKLLD